MNCYVDFEWDRKTREITEGYVESDTGVIWECKGEPTYEELMALVPIFRTHVIVGHNVTSDISIVRQCAKRHGIEIYFKTLSHFCTLRASREKLRLDEYTLEAVAKALNYKVNFEERHTAEYDALLCRDVFRKLRSVYGSGNHRDIKRDRRGSFSGRLSTPPKRKHKHRSRKKRN